MSLRSGLSDAMTRNQVVRVYREGLEDGWATGYIVGVGPDFFAIELIDKGLRFDGFNCIRYRDVSDCAVPAPHWEFVEKALRARSLERTREFKLDLSTLPNLLTSASKLFSAVTLRFEGDEGYCHIGSVHTIAEDHVVLREITTDGGWESDLTRHELGGVTRVDFGGAYEAALCLVAGLS